MIDNSLLAVVQFDFHFFAAHACRNGRSAEAHRNVLKSVDQPSSARGADRTSPEPVLSPARESPRQIRSRHNLTDACRSDVRGGIQKLGDSLAEASVYGSRNQTA